MLEVHTDNRRILALIPARGGSKSIPRKNLNEIAGRPLICWSIMEALKCQRLSRVVVSTDDLEIARVAVECGADVPFLRPAEFARDDTPGIEPVLHALRELPNFDFVMVLQPTSPLRTKSDMDAAIDLMFERNADSVVSVTETDAHPMWTYDLDEGGRLRPLHKSKPVLRRQELPRAYVLNGAIYLSRVAQLQGAGSLVTNETLALTMPQERSIDIDTPFDWKIAEFLLKNQL